MLVYPNIITAENIDDHVFYLAVAPKFFGVIASGLKAVKEASLGKVILEKTIW